MTVDDIAIAAVTGTLAIYFAVVAVRIFAGRRQPTRPDAPISEPWVAPKAWDVDDPRYRS